MLTDEQKATTKEVLNLLASKGFTLEESQKVLSEAESSIGRVLFEPVEARKMELLSSHLR